MYVGSLATDHLCMCIDTFRCLCWQALPTPFKTARTSHRWRWDMFQRHTSCQRSSKPECSFWHDRYKSDILCSHVNIVRFQVLELIRDPEGFTLFLMIILSDGIDVNQSLQHQYVNMYLRRHAPLALLGSGKYYENDTKMLANGIAQVKELAQLLQILLKGGNDSS